MNNICKVAALKVQCKQRYRLLKIRKCKCLQKRLDWDYSWVLDVTNPYICINPPSGIRKKGHDHISAALPKRKSYRGELAMPSKVCYFHPGVRSSVFGLPKDAVVRQQWLQFMFDNVSDNYNRNLALCAAHFTEDSFLNLQ